MKQSVFVFYRLLKRMFNAAVVTSLTLAVLAGGILELHAADDQKKSEDNKLIRSSVVSTLNNNPRLTEIKQNRFAVEKDLRQTKGRYYPRVDLNAGIGVDSHSDPGTRNRGEENDFERRGEAGITLIQPLYQGGEIRSLVEKQTAKLESANFRVYDNAESLALDAIIAHVEVWRQRRLLELTEQNIRTHEKILDHISERQRSGVGSSAEVMQTKGRLALTRSSRVQISGALESARANFLRFVGRYPEKLVLPENFRLLAPAGAEKAIETAQGCNPKLAALTEDIRSLRSEIGVKKSNFLPKVNLELSSTYEDQVESSTSYTHNNAAMVRARWNLFNGGSDTAARDAASFRKLELVSTRKDQYQIISEQIRDTWSQYQRSGQQTKTYADAVRYNKKTRDAYQQQFVVGQRSLLDVLDSENELFQSSGQLSTAKANEVIAVYRLLALSGCLLTSLELDVESFELTPVSKKCCPKPESLDSDGDGVIDNLDRCPNTKPGLKVDIDGCPLDSDGDGVLDVDDLCPNTPKGVAVDDKGCPKLKPKATKSAQVTAAGTWLYKDIKFKINKYDLKSSSYDVLDEIAAWMKSKPKLIVEVQGHSDNIGQRDYNIALSQKRAQSVITYLKHKGLDSARMTPKGFGPDRPMAGNENAGGRAQNRRVEIKPLMW